MGKGEDDGLSSAADVYWVRLTDCKMRIGKGWRGQGQDLGAMVGTQQTDTAQHLLYFGDRCSSDPISSGTTIRDNLAFSPGSRHSA